MEFLLLVVLIVAFLWLRSIVVGSFSKQQYLIESLMRDLDKLRVKMDAMHPAERPAPHASPTAKPVEAKEEVVQKVVAPVVSHVGAQKSTDKQELPRPQPIVRPQPAPRPVAEPRPSFFERHPDIEKFVGENLINKIGIAILVLGIGFFVKYAIDQNWINEIGRLAIGILCGGVLIAIAHRLRKSFLAFSSVLIGGGLSVLYFSIGTGFHDYHLLSQTAAFAVMVVITVFAVVLSMLYNRKELAVIALVGGFGTPFFVSTGEGNYVVLFSYLMILNVGMTVLSVHKKWSLVNVLSYIFTLIIYGGWLATKVNGDAAPYGGALLFGGLFYLLFFAMNVGYNIKNKQPFKALDISMLVSNSFFFFVAGMVCLSHINDGAYRGLFTAGLGIFNYLFAQLVYRKQGVDRNLFYLLVGLVLSFISLAAPIQLKGNYITLFWAAEGVLLLWLSQKAGIELIKKASLLVVGLMLVSLFMDWSSIYFQTGNLNIINNKAFVTSMSVVLSLGLYRKLIDFEKTNYFLMTWAWSVAPVKLLFVIAATTILYVGLYLELWFQLTSHFDLSSAHTVVLAAYTLLFATVLMVVVRNKVQLGMSWMVLLFGMVLTLMYCLLFNPALIEVRGATLSGAGGYGWVFQFHYFVALALLGVVYFAGKRGVLVLKAENMKPNVVYWLSMAIVVFVLSAELDHLTVWMLFKSPGQADELLAQTHKFGYPILWGMVSFALIVYGLKRKMRLFRVISLALFGLIILKLFLVDVWGMNKVGKIAAFVSLGVLMLVVSFMYQKLKGLLAEKEEVPSH